MRISYWSSDVCSSDLHAKTGAFPFAGLLQHMLPGNQSVAAVIETDAGQAHMDGFSDIGQQTAIVGHASQKRQISLCNTEGQSGARSEESRGGTECVSRCITRWGQYLKTKNTNI